MYIKKEAKIYKSVRNLLRLITVNDNSKFQRKSDSLKIFATNDKIQIHQHIPEQKKAPTK